jgi:branched-chain amino acid transport system substrate-binding protein
MTITRVWIAALLATIAVCGQGSVPCSCGANPPPPPRSRELRPYSETPKDLRPFSNFAEPYFEHYTKSVEYNGAARDAATLNAADVDEVRIGFLGPIENHPDVALGRMMLSGAKLALEEANATGGYGGKPFRLMIHNDQAVWGSASNEVVRMAYDEKVWGMLGSISGDSTHIALRVSLKAEVPIVNSAATDPTIPETIIPWYLTTIQDDRVQGYTLARRIFTDRKLERVALLRVNDRYGRFGVLKFKDAARRLGNPVLIEQKYMPGATDFRRQLRIIAESDADSIVIWGDAGPAAAIVKQLRDAGMNQPVFGSFRVIGAGFLEDAGTAAEGLEAVYPFDPTREDPSWLAFRKRFTARFQQPPDIFASLAYDTMNILLQSICRAGLNRGQIRDALAGLEHFHGVTGEMAFDPNSKNMVPLYLAAVRNGKFVYRRYPMEEPHAIVGEKSFHGPETPDGPAGPSRIAVIGPDAPALASRLTAAAEARPRPYSLIGVTSNAPWGKATAELVRLIYDEHVIAIVATDRNTSHLAEQLAAKAFVPVVTTSADKTLTSANVPWLFLAPSGEEAVRMVMDAADASGPNRSVLRDRLAASPRQ